MAGLMSPRFEAIALRPQQRLSDVEIEKNFELTFLKLERVASLKKNLTSVRLNATELALAEMSLERLEESGQRMMRLETHQDLQRNLVVRCEGILGSIWDAIKRMFRWIGEKLGLINENTSSSSSSSVAADVEETIDRVEEKVARKPRAKKAGKEELSVSEKFLAEAPEREKQQKESEKKYKKLMEEIKIKRAKASEENDIRHKALLEEQARKLKEMFDKEKEEWSNHVKEEVDKIDIKDTKLYKQSLKGNEKIEVKANSVFTAFFAKSELLPYVKQLEVMTQAYKTYEKISHSLAECVSYIENIDEFNKKIENAISNNKVNMPGDIPKIEKNEAAIYSSCTMAALISFDPESEEIKKEKILFNKNYSFGVEDTTEVTLDESKLIIKGAAAMFLEISRISKVITALQKKTETQLKAFESKQENIDPRTLKALKCFFTYMAAIMIPFDQYKEVQAIFKKFDTLIKPIENN